MSKRKILIRTVTIIIFSILVVMTFVPMAVQKYRIPCVEAFTSRQIETMKEREERRVPNSSIFVDESGFTYIYSAEFVEGRFSEETRVFEIPVTVLEKQDFEMTLISFPEGENGTLALVENTSRKLHHMELVRWVNAKEHRKVLLYSN